MKKYIFSILTIIFSICTDAYAQFNYDFKSENRDGAELAYKLLDDNVSVALTYDTDGTPTIYNRNYANLGVDTFRIPEYVTYNNKQYTVTTIDKFGCALLDTRIKSIIIPKTVTDIKYECNFVDELSFINNGVQSIIVDKDNPNFCSISGVLYTKDLKSIISYPSEFPCDTVRLQKGTEIIKMGSIMNSYMKYVDLPLSVKRIEMYNFMSQKLEQLILKDSISELMESSIYVPSLKKLVLGTGLKFVNSGFVYGDAMLQIYCQSTTPPKTNVSFKFLSEKIIENGTLYVPNKSLSLYRQAEGWSQFKNIFPIEPPIVSGVNEAEVSWVQNFSATGYVWTLYLDEAQTQPYLQLTFDKDGHLTNIDLNRPNVPQLPAEEGDSEPAQRYAKYYSFTITGLDANTKYYYTRQTLAGERVIDEETGSFETLPDGAPTGINPLLFEPQPQKTFENGMLRIRKNGNTYNVNGTKVE